MRPSQWSSYVVIGFGACAKQKSFSVTPPQTPSFVPRQHASGLSSKFYHGHYAIPCHLGDQHICYHYGLYPLLLCFLRPDRWQFYSKALDYLASLGFYIFISVSTQQNLWSLKTLHAMSYTSVFTSCLFPYVLILWALWLNKFLNTHHFTPQPPPSNNIFIFFCMYVLSQ